MLVKEWDKGKNSKNNGLACFLDQIQIANILFPRGLVDICYVKQIKQE